MATPLFEMEIPTKFPRNYYQDQLNTYMKNGISPYTIDNYEKSKLLISKKKSTRLLNQESKMN